MKSSKNTSRGLCRGLKVTHTVKTIEQKLKKGKKSQLAIKNWEKVQVG